MERFKYIAKDKKGRKIEGIVEAADIRSAVRLVSQKGLIVINIHPAQRGIKGLLERFGKNVSHSELTNFTRQFSTMINAGLTVVDALSILKNQTKGELQRVVSQILVDVEGGLSLSKAMEKHPKVFSSTYVALVHSGETGGVLDEVFMRLAENLEKEREFRGKVKGALIYPAIIIVGMIIVSFIMMIFVIPRLTALYKEFNAQLPLPTRILIGVSSFFLKSWPLFLLFSFLLFYGFSIYRKTPSGRKKTDELLLKIPIIGPLTRQVILTELTRTLSLMVGSGVSVLESLEIAAGVIKNSVVSDALLESAEDIKKGFPVAYAMAKHPDAFPFILTQMVSVGEETGKISEVLLKISHVFEVESDQQVKILTAAAEPLIMVLLGIGVGFLVIAVILPIYNLTSQF